ETNSFGKLRLVLRLFNEVPAHGSQANLIRSKSEAAGPHYEVGGGDFGSNREMMISSTTTTSARIPQNTTPPVPGISCSRHDDFRSCCSAASEAVALSAASNCPATRLRS